jgi:ketosteroid isomerase-like protein
MRNKIHALPSLCVALVLAVLMLSGVVESKPAGASPTSGDQTAIRTLLQSQQEAWNRGDIETFMVGYWKSDKTEFVGSSGILRGWQGVLDRYRKSYPDQVAMGKLTFSDLEITMLSSDSAYILGRWQLEREKDRPGGVFTLIARKYPEGWRIIHDHTSAFASPSAEGHK